MSPGESVGVVDRGTVTINSRVYLEIGSIPLPVSPSCSAMAHLLRPDDRIRYSIRNGEITSVEKIPPNREFHTGMELKKQLRKEDIIAVLPSATTIYYQMEPSPITDPIDGILKLAISITEKIKRVAE